MLCKKDYNLHYNVDIKGMENLNKISKIIFNNFTDKTIFRITKFEFKEEDILPEIKENEFSKYINILCNIFSDKFILYCQEKNKYDVVNKYFLLQFFDYIYTIDDIDYFICKNLRYEISANILYDILNDQL